MFQSLMHIEEQSHTYNSTLIFQLYTTHTFFPQNFVTHTFEACRSNPIVLEEEIESESF